MSSDRDTTSAEDQARAGQLGGALAVGLAIGLAVVAGLLRLVPHPWNMAPVGALGLFGGARLRGWLAYVLPLLVMVVTDGVLLVISLSRGTVPAVNEVTPFIYASFLVNVLLGRLLTRTRSPLWIGAAAVAGSVQFFLVTNFAFWLSGYYGLTLAGLGECYVKAIPFYRGTLAGDVLYTGLFFGLHALTLHLLSVRRQARALS
jgi:hypothetical protein